MKITECMKRPVVGIRTIDSIADATRTMEDRGIRHLLVYDPDGRLAGIVSDHDLREFPPSRTPEGTKTDPASVRVEQAMRRDVVTIDPDTNVAEAAALLVDGRIGALPVMEKDAVVGIVSSVDLLEILADRDRMPPPLPEDAKRRTEVRFRRDLTQVRSVAVVGIDPDPASFSYLETTKLMSTGLTVYPVHPTASVIAGVRCYPDLASIPVDVDVIQVFPDGRLDLSRTAREACSRHPRVFWFEGPAPEEELRPFFDGTGIDVISGHRLQVELFRKGA